MLCCSGPKVTACENAHRGPGEVEVGPTAAVSVRGLLVLHQESGSGTGTVRPEADVEGVGGGVGRGGADGLAQSAVLLATPLVRVDQHQRAQLAQTVAELQQNKEK